MYNLKMMIKIPHWKIFIYFKRIHLIEKNSREQRHETYRKQKAK